MTSLGLKIVGEEMEVGFTVLSRDELNVAIDRLYAMADTVWPTEQAPVDDVDMTLPATDKGLNWARPPRNGLVPGITEEQRDAVWRESQGLR